MRFSPFLHHAHLVKHAYMDTYQTALAQAHTLITLHTQAVANGMCGAACLYSQAVTHLCTKYRLSIPGWNVPSARPQ